MAKNLLHGDCAKRSSKNLHADFQCILRCHLPLRDSQPQGVSAVLPQGVAAFLQALDPSSPALDLTKSLHVGATCQSWRGHCQACDLSDQQAVVFSDSSPPALATYKWQSLPASGAHGYPLMKLCWQRPFLDQTAPSLGQMKAQSTAGSRKALERARPCKVPEDQPFQRAPS